MVNHIVRWGWQKFHDYGDGTSLTTECSLNTVDVVWNS